PVPQLPPSTGLAMLASGQFAPTTIMTRFYNPANSLRALRSSLRLRSHRVGALDLRRRGTPARVARAGLVARLLRPESRIQAPSPLSANAAAAVRRRAAAAGARGAWVPGHGPRAHALGSGS